MTAIGQPPAVPATVELTPRERWAITLLQRGGQHQGSATDQVQIILRLGNAAGCYEGVDRIKQALGLS